MNAQSETIEFCHVHGYAHPDGELEWVETIPPELVVDVDEAGDPIIEPCHTEEWNVMVLDPEEFEVTEEHRVLRQNRRGFFTLKAGDLAYVYTIRGSVVPCKVLTVADDGETTVLVTADRLGWRKGAREVLRAYFAKQGVKGITAP